MRYKGLGQGVEVGPAEALIQAASALDAAGAEASRRGDVEGLIQVGVGWMKLSEEIIEYSRAIQTEEEKEETPKGEMIKGESGKIETGFRFVPQDTIIAEEDTND